MPHVFISYVRENQDEVDRLCEELTEYGVRVWLDRNDIEPGARWRQEIRRAIRDGAFFIACFSEEYRGRSIAYMSEELTLAIEILRQLSTDKSWFIPIKLNDCEIPDRDIGAGETLQNLQYVELYKDWDAGVQGILDVIQPIPAEDQKLMESLDSDEEEVRIAAVKALSIACDNRVLPVLIEKSIGMLSNGLFIPAPNVVDDLEHEGSIRTAAFALVRIGEPAVPALIEALGSGKVQVRPYFSMVLRMIGTPEALKAVEEYEKRMKDGGDV